MRAHLDHIVLVVADVERALSFYLDVLELDPCRVEAWRRGDEIFPSVRVNENTIIDFLALELLGETGFDQDKRGTVHNLNHFCLAVQEADWGPLMKRLGEVNLKPDSKPQSLQGARGMGHGIYTKDPDGNVVELRWYDDGSRQ